MYREDQISTDTGSTLNDEIMIVDDDRDNLELMEGILHRAGYKVRFASNGKSALKSIKAKHPSIVLLNIILPEIDGFEICTRLRADLATRDIPIIFISALGDRDSKLMGYRAGGIDYITKPIFKEEILTKVKLHFETRQILNDLKILNSKYLNEITERKLVEKSEKENKERYRTLFEYAPIGYQSLDINGFFIEVNETWLQTLGYSRDEVIGKWFGDFLTPKYNEGFRERFPIFKSLGTIHSEFEMIKKDGSIIFIAFEGRIGYNSAGEFKQTHCVLNDITQRKQAEEELQHARDRFQTIFEQAPLGIALVDSLSGKILEVNSGFAKIVGRTREEMAATDWMTITHPDDLQVDQVNKDRMNAGEINGYRMNKRYIRPDGSIVWVSVIVAKVQVSEKMNPRHLSMIEDITSRKQVEESLVKSERELSLLAESMPQIVWITRADGWNIYFNQQWVDYTGLTMEESFGHGWVIPFHPDDSGRAWDAWQDAVNNNGVYSIECRLRRKDGIYRWWLIRGVPIFDEEGNISRWFGTCTDIEDIKQMEVSLIETKAMLQAAFDNSQAGIAIAEAPRGKLIYVNEAALMIRDRPASQIVDNVDVEKYVSTWNILDLKGDPYKPEDVPLARAVLYGEKCSREFIVRRDNMEDRIVWANAAPIFDDEGKVKFGIMVFLDITERKMDEEALRENEELLSLFIEHSPILAYIKKVSPTESRVIMASENFIDLIGIPGSEMGNKTMEDLFPPDLAKKFTADDWEVVSTGKILKVEEELNGRYYNTIKFPITMGGNKKLAGYSIEITERKLAEEKIRHFNEELENLVLQRTAELNESILELEEQSRVFVGRELVMMELKKKIEELEKGKDDKSPI